jgi:mannose-6-phosphate isomerase-like protein (cupin superfamily)
MEKVRIADKFALFEETWTPKIVGELNGSYVLLAKLEGEFVWHKHEAEDELFLVIKGKLLLKLRDRDVRLEEGEFFIVPKGVEHLPIADDGAQVVMLEPKSTKHTGDIVNERTVTEYEHI